MTAFLALWNRITSPALQREYETWHAFEHVPERVGLPGFAQARRYRSWDVDAAGVPLYFTWYGLDHLDALDTPQYRDVFAQPTPWSARMRTQLRAFDRQPCTLAGAWGTSGAGQLCTLQLRGGAQAWAVLERVLAALVHDAQLVSAQWGQVQAAPAFVVPIPNSANSAGRSDTAPGTDAVLLLQGLDRATLAASAAQLVAALATVAHTVRPPEFFELQTQVRQADLAHPLTARQPALMPLFHSFTTGDTP